jgi:hypothetical protein
MGRILAALITVSIVLALIATLTHSNVLGWSSVVAFVLALLAYVRWRLARRRPMW